MEEMLSQFTGYGVIGVISYKLFSTFLNEKQSDKEAYKEELKELRTMYREELKQDRELYQNSMSLIVGKLENLEEKISEIEKNINFNGRY